MSSIAKACIEVLQTADPHAKAMAARRVARAWRRGRLAHRFDALPPTRPARPDTPELLPPSQMPKRRKAGSDRARIAMLHALAHIEFVAIDLAFDMAARFGEAFPPEFIDDWLRVGAEEAMHFALIDRRLRSLGSHYGALPAHDGLWDAAQETAHDVMARLAVVPMVLEARALDITPAMVARFERIGDTRTALNLGRIMRDEESHVGVGTKWFKLAANRKNLCAADHWQTLVKRHFRGLLKPPFNDSARRRAGLTQDFYAALASPAG